MNSSSPSFIEIELTTALPCTHFRPASMIRELRGIDHHRHARDVGLAGDQIEERDHRLLGLEQALVHVDVDHLRAVLDLVARDRERRVVVAGRDQLAEFGRAGDVGALADIDERDFGRERERLEPREPQQRLDGSGTWRGGLSFTASAMARMCAGVVPQQPPTMLTSPRARELAEQLRHVFGALVVKPELVRQAGVRIGADQRIGDARRAPRCARASPWRRARS